MKFCGIAGVLIGTVCHFYFSVISNCIQLLVQDLDCACDPALSAMTKVYYDVTILKSIC